MVQLTIITSVALVQLAQNSIGLPILPEEERRWCKRFAPNLSFAEGNPVLTGLSIGCAGSAILALTAWGCYKCIHRGHPNDIENTGSAPAQAIELSNQGAPHDAPPIPGPSTEHHSQQHRRRDLTRAPSLPEYRKRELGEMNPRELDLDELD